MPVLLDSPVPVLLDLPGPSRRIRVEPVRLPRPEPLPLPARPERRVEPAIPPAEREPAPAAP